MGAVLQKSEERWLKPKKGTIKRIFTYITIGNLKLRYAPM